MENMAAFATPPALRPGDQAAWRALAQDFAGIVGLSDDEVARMRQAAGGGLMGTRRVGGAGLGCGDHVGRELRGV